MSNFGSLCKGLLQRSIVLACVLVLVLEVRGREDAINIHNRDRNVEKRKEMRNVRDMNLNLMGIKSKAKEDRIG